MLILGCVSIISVSCVLVSAWTRLIHVDSGLCLETGSTVLQECDDECSDGQVSNFLNQRCYLRSTKTRFISHSIQCYWD